MATNAKIHRTRTALLTTLIAGLALGAFSLMIGIGLPGFILSVIGWIAFFVAAVWLITRAIRKPASATQSAPWRPADQN
ncbi:hypothetical protein [Microbacterium sp. GXF6406]